MPVETAPSRSIYMDQSRLQALCELGADKIEDVLDALEINLNCHKDHYSGKCVIHGGDSPTSFNLYMSGHSQRGNFSCFTRHCEKLFRPTLIGLCRGRLSHLELGWERPGDQVIPFKRAVDFLADVVKTPLGSVDFKSILREKASFTRTVALFNPEKQIHKMWIAKRNVENATRIPSEYFLRRRFPAGLLNDFCVSDCTDPTKPFFNRAVVPIFDETGRYMIGCTGRSIFERCTQCNWFHQPGGCTQSPKWLNSHNFKAKSCLYNFANAVATEKESLILVEGSVDCWSAVRAGFPNCMAVLGDHLTDEQQILLEKTGFKTLIFVFDSDEAGRAGSERSIQRVKRLYRTKNVALATKDFGEMTDDEIRGVLC